MAATIAKCIGYDMVQEKTATRLGSEASEGQANTYRTFVTAHVRRDGSGYVEVRRDGKTIHEHRFEPECHALCFETEKERKDGR